mmetsp:Transcript_2973/g.5306  ORF Transcript_2973/g.5306 Transcript_2973/m.5306 type:complete len:624 (+) Transcript_2973:161-2032(+)
MIPITITGKVLYSDVGISFWGGIDPLNGNVIDQTHPLHGKCIKDAILCIPSGRGSCTGSQVMLELCLNGNGPQAIILRDVDAILCTGAVIAEEFFNDENISIPMICAVGEERFSQLQQNGEEEVTISIESNQDNEDVVIRINCKHEICSKNLLAMKSILSFIDGCDGEAQQPKSQAEKLAQRVVQRIGCISGATELIPITSAHIDAVTYIGQGGLRFAQRLVELDGKVKVPTTLNSQSTDRRRWEQLGIDKTLATNANSVGDAYLELGCAMSFTCAPYLLPNKPSKGDNIMWGESNAVVFSNSVLGARTEKYADYFDICAAIVGLVPNTGVHQTENRKPSIVIDATDFIEEHLLPQIHADMVDEKCVYKSGIDSFFPAMGWLSGNLSDGRIPLILGFDLLPSVSRDNLKAFCAAYGTTGSSPLFHMANITPEAMGDNVINDMIQACGDKRVQVSKEDVVKAYTTLDSGKQSGDDISLVALGNPHLSVEEMKDLIDIISLDDRPKNESVKVIATLGRHIQSEAGLLGKRLEEFGVTLLNDTCWCMLLHPPIIPSTNPSAKILTNSGKYAHYGPGLTNCNIRFGSMYQCIEAAKSGRMGSNKGAGMSWLRHFSTHTLIRHIRKIR